jgi:hypothetical protein
MRICAQKVVHLRNLPVGWLRLAFSSTDSFGGYVASVHTAWDYYNEQASTLDKERNGVWVDQMDAILLFVGLSLQSISELTHVESSVDYLLLFSPHS